MNVMGMAGLAGTLRSMQIADLLQWLANGQATGTLVLNSGVIEKQIYFRAGQIIAAGSSDPREYLGHFLVSHGFITEQQLTAAMARQEQTKVLLGKVLVDEGFISLQDLERMLQLKSREGIYDLFGWQDGGFRFQDGELPAYDMVPLSIGVTGLLMEAMQRMDEWEGIRKVVPSIDHVPVSVTDLPIYEDAGDGERAVVAAVDDDRSVADICLQTHSSEYYVSKVIKQLAEQRLVKLVRPRALAAAEPARGADAPTLMKQAWDRFREGDYQGALRHSRAAATLEPDNEGVRKHVANLEKALVETMGAEGVRTARVPKLLVSPSKFTSLPLTPAEGFILTRIDGTSSLGSLLKITPIAQLDALLVFYRLLSAGYIRLDPPT
jgi:hypothetical protein